MLFGPSQQLSQDRSVAHVILTREFGHALVLSIYECQSENEWAYHVVCVNAVT
jgi:hypothetical protein